MERTLSIIKPDGIKKGLIGEIIRRFEVNRLKVVALKMIKMTKEQAESFYQVHKDKRFFNSLTSFMSSGPVVVMVIEGIEAVKRNRELMGATDPREAGKGTIRKDFASDVEKNIVHGSDSPETAQWEINYFFPEKEIFEYE
jgi:nucleoside-diphosphate kinase